MTATQGGDAHSAASTGARTVVAFTAVALLMRPVGLFSSLTERSCWFAGSATAFAGTMGSEIEFIPADCVRQPGVGVGNKRTFALQQLTSQAAAAAANSHFSRACTKHIIASMSHRSVHSRSNSHVQVPIDLLIVQEDAKDVSGQPNIARGLSIKLVPPEDEESDENLPNETPTFYHSTSVSFSAVCYLYLPPLFRYSNCQPPVLIRWEADHSPPWTLTFLSQPRPIAFQTSTHLVD